MGLAVEVGVLVALDDEDEETARRRRRAFNRINKLLAENGLPAHREPETLPPSRNRAFMRGYPYSFLHHLRRFYAHAKARPRWKPEPCPESLDPAEDPRVFDELAMLRSHLVCHSDCEGFYVPVDFPDPLFTSEKRVPGGMLGSSQGLMRELVAVAPLLGIKLVRRRLGDAEAGRINRRVKRQGRFWIELAVWLSLFEAARLSIEHGTAIRFA
jgi:hypothetical protein